MDQSLARSESDLRESTELTSFQNTFLDAVLCVLCNWLECFDIQSSAGKKDGGCTFYHNTMRASHSPGIKFKESHIFTILVPVLTT